MYLKTFVIGWRISCETFDWPTALNLLRQGRTVSRFSRHFGIQLPDSTGYFKLKNTREPWTPTIEDFDAKDWYEVPCSTK